MLTSASTFDVRPWLYHFSLASRITEAEKRKRKLSSAGNCRITKKGGKKNVSFGFTSYQFDAILIGNMLPSCIQIKGTAFLANPQNIFGLIVALRTGGPLLKDTQSYPDGFCNKVVGLHKRFCVEPWWSHILLVATSHDDCKHGESNVFRRCSLLTPSHMVIPGTQDGCSNP